MDHLNTLNSWSQIQDYLFSSLVISEDYLEEDPFLDYKTIKQAALDKDPLCYCYLACPIDIGEFEDYLNSLKKLYLICPYTLIFKSPEKDPYKRNFVDDSLDTRGTILKFNQLCLSKLDSNQRIELVLAFNYLAFYTFEVLNLNPENPIDFTKDEYPDCFIVTQLPDYFDNFKSFDQFYNSPVNNVKTSYFSYSRLKKKIANFFNYPLNLNDLESKLIKYPFLEFYCFGQIHWVCKAKFLYKTLWHQNLTEYFIKW